MYTSDDKNNEKYTGIAIENENERYPDMNMNINNRSKRNSEADIDHGNKRNSETDINNRSKRYSEADFNHGNKRNSEDDIDHSYRNVERNKKKARRHCLIGYLSAAVFCFIFQLIYESFSHGVISYYMVLAFLIPLIGGAVSYASFYMIDHPAGSLFRQLICAGIIWLTLGSIFQGVLEIYGTTNKLVVVYLIAGIAHLAASFAVILTASIYRDLQ